MTQTGSSNVRTHTATVHAGRTHLDGRLVPVCMSNTQVSELHYSAPTTDEVTCRRCLGGTTTLAASPEVKKARQAEARQAAKIAALTIRVNAPVRGLASHTEQVEFLSSVVADTTRTPAQRAAAASDLVERLTRYAALVADAAEALTAL